MEASGALRAYGFLRDALGSTVSRWDFTAEEGWSGPVQAARLDGLYIWRLGAGGQEGGAALAFNATESEFFSSFDAADLHGLFDLAAPPPAAEGSYSGAGKPSPSASGGGPASFSCPA